ncbi:MAG TPA: T9SS type A sorting domain-containing protein [Ignavibacteria bacterium]|nr:T9SS type A sorting domain-containing protein [Ignavibacteria bacterium]
MVTHIAIYSALDTSGDQNITDVLFGDLKQYLQGRINTSNYTEDFERLAFDVILMCETKMKNYEVALTGYEFIALYHPNAEQRMLASWDYEEIEELINGSSGGEKKLQIKNFELQVEELSSIIEMKEFERIEKVINDDPLMSMMKVNYEKINMSKDDFNPDDRSNKKRQIEDDKIKTRAKDNILKSKFLDKEQKEIRFMEDTKLILNKGNQESKIDNNKFSELKEFKLNQNYPNPFNPTTTISFYIPVSSFVNLKVFDISGKEIETLINEYKQNGSYQVTFNGINLSSGIYYFRISAGEFIKVSKMMLIK